MFNDMKPDIIIALCCLLFSSFLFAEGNAMRKLKCATTHYPPFTVFTTEYAQPTGLDMDILNRLAADFNWQIDVDNLPWERLKRELGNNYYDCFFSMGDFNYRHVFVEFTTTPMHVTRYGVFTRTGNKDKLIKSFGTMRGVAAPDNLMADYHLTGLPEVKANDNAALIELLHLGRIDAFITNAAVGQYEVEKLGLSDEISLDVFPGYQLPTFLVFSKHASDIDINAVNVWLKENLP